jgi:sporulation protein YlmC with PRC-barrel domain
MSEAKSAGNDGTRHELSGLLKSGKATFFSQFIGKSVVDKDGRVLGSLKDFSIRPGESLLEVSGIVYREGLLREVLGHDVIVGMAGVASIDRDIKLTVAREDIPPGRLPENEMLITDIILDKQIVDIDDLKVVRVNDVLLAWIKGSLCLVGVDVGFNGIMRRLGLMWVPRRLKILKFPEHIISWSYIDPLNPALRKVHLKIPRKNVMTYTPPISQILSKSLITRVGSPFYSPWTRRPPPRRWRWSSPTCARSCSARCPRAKSPKSWII